MTPTTAALLAAGEKKGNFLIPNGTFFVELLIFVIVLAVIWKFVVPPIQEVLQNREDRVAKTNEDNLKAAQALQEAERKYSEELAGARAEARAVRDQARAEGQHVLAEARATTQAEADAAQARANSELRAQAEQVGAQLKDSVVPLSEQLASRVLSGKTGGADATGVASGFAGRS